MVDFVFFAAQSASIVKVYMTEREQHFWFRAKSYGYGWGIPACWQGWIVLVLYLGLVVATVRFSSDKAKLPVIVGLTVAFIVVVVLKGERSAKWRWGKD